MQHVTTFEEAHPAGPTIVAVGVFDGVHRGHQFLLQRLVEDARRTGAIPTVLTFFPHPDVVLGRAEPRHYLMTPEQRAAALAELGVELVVTHPFDASVRETRAADFVDRMLAHLRLRELWVGADFALGYKREGNVAFLRQQGQEKGFTLETVELVANDSSGATISSSGIRQALREGDVEQAWEWLGRPYRLAAEVVHGDGRGRTIGFPTANMDVWEEQLLPQNGVYAGWAYLNGETFMSVANVGQRPTFEGNIVRMEAHLLDFDRDIYGQVLAFDFVARLRPEMRFDGIDALVAQIRQDAEQGRQILTQQSPPDTSNG